ncbi:nitroreductase [Gemmobacter sp.]|uniref:nitroreductase family protein n=1 Tax=Gemmobacter sp. TaxID=1898957 RepID=UPI002AFE0163|nr:nitroreductase [Gemmobacter sp.]
MTMPHTPVLDFLLTRRSRPAKLLAAPVPDRAGLELLLTAAARVPDHGKLEPWRFIVLEKPALNRIADAVVPRAAERGMDAEQTAKGRSQFDDSPLAVAVIASPKGFERIPEIEQTLSAGAVCLSLLNAALAAGWGASWLTGWAAHDRDFMAAQLGLQPGEWVAGFIHIGTAKSAPPDRPRPDLAAITTWVSA